MAGDTIVENQRAFVVRFLRAFVVCALFAIIVAASASGQTTTYTYTGSAFTRFSIPSGETATFFTCPPICKITGSLTMAEPLGPNFFGGITPLSFTFTDGLTTFTNLNSTFFAFAEVATNGQGQITLWIIDAIAPAAPGANISSIYGGSVNPTAFFSIVNEALPVGGGDTAEYYGVIIETGEYVQVEAQDLFSPGTWTSSCQLNKSDVTFYPLGPPLGPPLSANFEETGMFAQFQPTQSGTPISLIDLAQQCNYTAFDWQQTITKYPAPSNPTSCLPTGPVLCLAAINNPFVVLATPPGSAFSDPPPVGYTYFLYGNPALWDAYYLANPFYYNPAKVPTDCAEFNKDGSSCKLPISSSDDFTLYFFDQPKDYLLPAGQNMAFTTSLVGVLNSNGSNVVGPVIRQWSWISTYNGENGGVEETASSVPDDGSGTGGITITNIDGVPQTPPTVGCMVNPNTLWPPNGKSVTVTVSGNITAGTSALTATTYAVIDEYGQDHPSGSITLGAGGSYSFTVPLIASRNGNDPNGRTYTIYVRAQDPIGNVGVCSTVVTVPHDQG